MDQRSIRMLSASNFSDTYNNQIGPGANQINLYGYGIGTFNSMTVSVMEFAAAAPSRMNAFRAWPRAYLPARAISPTKIRSR
jgi:hypothetical protein